MIKNGWHKTRKPKRKRVNFKPNHEFCDNAIADFLNDGGTIYRIDNKDFKMDPANVPSIEVDDFLLGL